jgi:uncharacterized protein YfaS (alpha-2-macroglobulin family)/TolA-binding protein
MYDTNHRSFIIVVSAILVFSVFAQNMIYAEEIESPFKKGKAHYLGRRFIKAAEILLTVKPDCKDASEAFFLAASAYNQAGDKRAETIFRKVMNNYPDSNYRAQAAFALAERFMSDKRWEDAAKILHSERERLTDPGRSAAWAKKYVKLGRRVMKSAQELQSRFSSTGLNLSDTKRQSLESEMLKAFAKAESYLRLAWRCGGLPDDNAQLLINLINVCSVLEKERDELMYYREFISKFPKHNKCNIIVLEYAEKLKANEPKKARKVLAEFIEKHPDSKYLPAATLTDIRIARAAGEDTCERLVWLVDKHTDSLVCRDALKVLFEVLVDKKKLQKAIKYLAMMQTRYPDDKDLPDMTKRLIVFCNEQGGYEEAIRAAEGYLKRFKHNPDCYQVQRQLRLAYFEIADSLYKQKKHETAIKAFREFIRLYPTSTEREAAEFKIARLLERGEKFHRAIDCYEMFFSRYPASSKAVDAFNSFARLIRKESKDLERLVKSADGLSQLEEKLGIRKTAKRVLDELRSVKLSAATPRIYRTDESAAVTIFTRNVEEINYQLHKVDLDVFFKKNKTVMNAGGLDTHFIPAQKSGTLEPENYKTLSDIRTDFSLGALPAGAYVLTLTSGNIYARTLVIVSDIACIVKSERDKTRILTIDMRQNKPVKDAVIYAAYESGIAGSGKTGEDGVHELSETVHGKDEKNILVTKGNHYAFGKIGRVQNMQGQWPGTRIFLATDRPIYKPGDNVNVWLLARWKEKGVYSMLADESLTLTMLNPRGTEIMSEELTTDDMGAAHFSYKLDKDPTPGDYRIQVQCKRKKMNRMFSIRFKVKSYTKPAITVDAVLINPEKYTPETREFLVRLTARYQSGAPAAGKKIRISVEGMRAWFPTILHDSANRLFESRFMRAHWRADTTLIGKADKFDIVTGAEGAFALIIPAPHYRKALKLRIQGSVHEDATTSGRKVPFAIDIPVSMPDAFAFASCFENKPVAGATVQLTAAAFKENGRRCALRGKIVVSRDVAGGRMTTSEIPVTTKTGSDQLISYIFPEAGVYYLSFRAESGNVLTESCRVNVREKHGGLSIPIEFGKPSYQAGEEMKLSIDAPPGERLALLTLEAEKVLFWKTILLKGGRQEITLPVKNEYQPNVYAVIASPSTQGLYTGKRMTYVLPILRVKITADRAAFRPGEKVKLKIRTTNESGRPTPATVALAVVDEAIFQITRPNAGSIRACFYPERRSHNVRTESTCGFKYRADTGTINNLYYAELQRRKRVKEEGLPPIYPHLALLRRGLRDKNLCSTSCVDAYGIGGGSAGAYGERWGRGFDRCFGCDAKKDLREVFPDTAYWNPDIRTGADGTAEVTFTAPDTLTEWRITAYGATRETAVGETTSFMRTEKPVAAFVSTPGFLRKGDTCTGSAWIGNFTDKTRSCKIRVPSMKSPVETKVSPGTGDIFMFSLPKAGGKAVSAEVSVAAGKYSDAIRRRIPVKSAAFRLKTGFSGVLRGRMEKEFDLPAGADPSSTSVIITFESHPSAMAKDALQYLGGYPYGCVEQTLSRFLPWIAWGKVHGTSGEAGKPAYREAAKRGISRLCDLQNRDGTWGWWRDQSGDPFITGYALLGLRLAKDAGFHVPEAVMSRGKNAARNLISNEDESFSLDGLTMLLYGAGVRSTRLETAALLELDHCSPAAHALMALAHLEAGDKMKAKPFLQKIRTSGYNEEEGSRIYESGENIWLGSPTASTALVLMALVEADGDTGTTRKIARGLLSLRTSRTWPSTKDTALAILALGRYYKAAQFTRPSQAVDVAVNGKKIGKVTHVKDKKIILTVPVKFLRGRGNLLSFSSPGAGELPYTVTVATLVKAENVGELENMFKLKCKTFEVSADGTRKSKDSKPPGYSIVWMESFPEKMKNTFVAGNNVRRQIQLDNPYDASHIIIEEPLIPGFVLNEKSIAAKGIDKKSFRFEVREDRIVFFITDSDWDGLTVTYDCHAAYPGNYNVPPTMAYAMYQPEICSVSSPTAFKIIKAGDVKHKTELPPDELYNRGLKAYESKKYEDAVLYFEPLLANYRLRPGPLSRTATALALSHLHLGHKDKTLSLYKRIVSKTGLGEIQQAEEKALADLFFGSGEFRDSAELDLRIIDETYREAIGFWENMPEAELFRPGALLNMAMDYPFQIGLYSELFHETEIFGDELPRSAGNSGFVPRLRCAVELFEALAVKEAEKHGGFRFISKAVETRLRSGDFENALETASLYAEAAKGDHDEPQALYFKAYALFALDRFGESAIIAERLTTKKFPVEAWDDSGKRTADRMELSEYRYNATHLLAQIAHKKGDYSHALELYKKAADCFEDARAMVRHLTRRELSAPAKVECMPWETPEIEVTSRNIVKLSVSVYPLDPMLIYCFRGKCVDLGRLNLVGLKENAVITVNVRPSKDLSTCTTKIALPKTDEGASLVLIRGEDRTVAVAVCATKIRIQRCTQGSRLRFIVTDRTTGKGIKGCLVKVFKKPGHTLDLYTDSRGVALCPAGVPEDAPAIGQYGKSFAIGW